jgi:hypothetical protein
MEFPRSYITSTYPETETCFQETGFRFQTSMLDILYLASGTVSLSGNSIGSYLLPIAKVPYVSPASP